jgi:predicted DNA-binding transcriptional regulator AlpA
MRAMPSKTQEELRDAGADDLWHIDLVCRFFGGTKPLNAATVYRNIKLGRIPAPIKTGPGSARWIPSECRAAREAMVAEREAAR